MPSSWLMLVSGTTAVMMLWASGCTQERSQFERISSIDSGVTFANILVPAETLNTYLFRNFYNGGGVAIGDVSGDGLPDIFLAGNQVSNRLYLNKGNLQFEDITEKSGLLSEGVWTTGVTMGDFNGDGWVDLYLCKSGPPGGDRRHNELMINSGQATFTDSAASYGLAIESLSVHASLLDYDRDGDLDMYLLSNSFGPQENQMPVRGLRNRYEPKGGNRLFRNDWIPYKERGFTDVTQEAGIYSSAIGFGLGVSVSDMNRDGWPDLYVSNDFFERDYLYFNNGDGSFSEVLPQMMGQISLSSMGGDIADINGDGWPEIFVSDMLPYLPSRLQSKIKFPQLQADIDAFEQGYHYQATRNTLHLNRGPRPYGGIAFSEIGRSLHIDATDWSWGGLFADFDLDGRRDLFIPNGIYKDLLDQDFLARMDDIDTLRSIMRDSAEPIMAILEYLPSEPLSNFLFAQLEPMQFQNMSMEWGLGEPGFSTGAAYGDLDLDGDLDLVINNVQGEASIYENHSEGRWLGLTLKGLSPNTAGIGAHITAWYRDNQWVVEQQPSRGFLSSVDPMVYFGLGTVEMLDSLVIWWPSGQSQTLHSVSTNQYVEVSELDARPK